MSVEILKTDCPGRRKCHGPANWCIQCGDVDLVCDDPRCDVHKRGDEREKRLAKAQRDYDTIRYDFGTAKRELAEAQRSVDRWNTAWPKMVARKS